MITAERDKTVLEHLPLVKIIAVKLSGELPMHVDQEDLVSAGIVGLFQAAENFDESKGVKFSSYAKHRVRGAMIDHLREMDFASRDQRRGLKALEAATRELQETLGRSPTDEELRERLQMDPEKFRAFQRLTRDCGLISLEATFRESDEKRTCDPKATEPWPDRMAITSQSAERLSEVMKTLTPRYQAVLQMYYWGERTMKEIAEALGINESRVSQIHANCLEKLAAEPRLRALSVGVGA